MNSKDGTRTWRFDYQATPGGQPETLPDAAYRRAWVEKLNNELSRCLLEKNVEGFLTRMHQADCRELLLRRIKYHTGGRCSDALKEVYQNLFVALATAALREKVDGDHPLRYVLWKARCLSLDYFRREWRIHQVVTASVDALLSNWNDRHSQEKFRAMVADVVEEVDRAAAPLPRKQAIVFQVFRDNLDSFTGHPNYQLLADEVSKRTGHPETTAAVRSALRNALDKIRSELVERLGKEAFQDHEQRCELSAIRKPRHDCADSVR